MCRKGVPAAALATLPVGLPRRVSAGDRHQPVTCSALCFKRISLPLVLASSTIFKDPLGNFRN